MGSWRRSLPERAEKICLWTSRGEAPESHRLFDLREGSLACHRRAFLEGLHFQTFDEVIDEEGRGTRIQRITNGPAGASE